MTCSQNWIFALSALLLMLQVGCEEQTSLKTEGLDNYGLVDGPFVPIPVKMRIRRDAILAEDDCHLFQNRDLPLARNNISAAWDRSMTAVQNITQAVSDMKACMTWNLFTVIPCAIHSFIELYSSYRIYRPQLAQLVHDVRASAGNASSTFISCAKILIIHQNQ